MSLRHFSIGEFWRQRLGPVDQTRRILVPDMSDIGRLAEIHAGAFARPWDTAEFDTFLTDDAVRIDALFLGRHAAPAGFVVARCVLDEAEILSVALAREVRRRGHSRPLLAYHLQHLAHRGVRHVHLEVEQGNLPALALYRGLNFVETGKRADYYARPDGTRADALSMTLHL